MSIQNATEQELKGKLSELRELRKMRAEADKSIGDLKESYGKLTAKIDRVKSQIRLLGGNVPAGSQYNDRMMLGHLIDGRSLSDERP